LGSLVGDLAQRVRAEAAEFIVKMLGPGKFVAGGSFADERGGFFALNVESGEELFYLLFPGTGALG